MPANKRIKVAVTGAAGQIGYSLLFRLASGETFGNDVEVDVHLVEKHPISPKLEAVVMELQDCAFPLLRDIKITSDLREGFQDVNWAILVGAVPRKDKSMQRKDLLKVNAPIFIKQGKALGKYASSDVRILVVGNPCNTNCYIARKQAPNIPDDRWFALTTLDENRAKFQLAAKADVPIAEVTNMAIWGNHSSTQFPDFFHARISDQPASQVISDDEWLREEFINQVQCRGGQIISKRGASSAASAANAIIRNIQNVSRPTPSDDFFSSGVISDGSYDVPEGLVFSYPLRSDGENFQIVHGIDHTDFAKEKLQATIKELEEERRIAENILFSNER